MLNEIHDFFIESEQKTPVVGIYDVIVVGGGVAGIAAALAAKRAGAKTLLIERSFIVGGLATSGLVTIYLPLCDGNGNQVSFGLAEELLRLSIKYGYEATSASVWLDVNGDKNARKNVRFQAQFNANIAALLFEKLLLEEGVEIIYGSVVCSVVTENARVKGVIVENKSGREGYAAKAFVDASGDADIFKLADARTEIFKQGNLAASWYYALENNSYRLKPIGSADIPDKYKSHDEKIKDTRKRYTGLDARELSELTFFSHGEILNDFIKDGGITAEHALCTLPTIPQIRMSRRICGAYILDDTEFSKRFEDSVGVIADWRKSGFVYEIPYGVLHGEYENLFACGRCVSVTDAAWDITRVIPACAVTGQAAGTAAAAACDGKVKIGELQSRLVSAGVKLHVL